MELLRDRIALAPTCLSTLLCSCTLFFGADTAQTMFLDQRSFGTEQRGRLSGIQAGSATTDEDHVVAASHYQIGIASEAFRSRGLTSGATGGAPLALAPAGNAGPRIGQTD
jgi:hypothetical protein